MARPLNMRYIYYFLFILFLFLFFYVEKSKEENKSKHCRFLKICCQWRGSGDSLPNLPNFTLEDVVGVRPHFIFPIPNSFSGSAELCM